MNTFIWCGVALMIATLLYGDIERIRNKKTSEAGPMDDRRKTQLWIIFIVALILILVGCLIR